MLDYVSAMRNLDSRLVLSFTLQVRTGFTQLKMSDIVGMRLRRADAMLCMLWSYATIGIRPAAAFCLWPIW